MKTDGTLYDVDPFWGRPCDPRDDQVDRLAAALSTVPPWSFYRYVPRPSAFAFPPFTGIKQTFKINR